jgi:hypothetical protein
MDRSLIERLKMETFGYEVTIKGLENIPLRTTRTGVTNLVDAFSEENANKALGRPMNDLTRIVVEQIDNGTPFLNSFVQIKPIDIPKKVVPKKAVAKKVAPKKEVTPKKVTRRIVAVKKMVRKVARII